MSTILCLSIIGGFSFNSVFAESKRPEGLLANSVSEANSIVKSDGKISRIALNVTDFEDIVSAKTLKQFEKKNEICGFETDKEASYGAQFVSVRRKLKLESDEDFKVKIFLKNTGNTPWFSGNSKCKGPHMSLGTDNPRDAKSQFFTKNIDGVENTNWESENRVGMDQLRVDPGKIASFTFYGKAPDRPDILKEYLTPVIEGIAWINDARTSVDFMVGDVKENHEIIRTRLSYANESGSAMDIPLDGIKSITVDLSEQKLYVKLGDYVIREFRVSTGKASTPTPKGPGEIFLKQEVRVGGEPPHYVMPYFMMFRAGGYGFHALPSLGGDGGLFWTEARDHIGIPVSHGCVRLLPEEAEFLYNFAEIGTAVSVQA